MIKTLLAVCLVGAAYAEADADAYYGGLGYGYGLHGLGYAGYGYGHHGLGYAGYGYHGVPFGSSTGLDPITQGLDASTQGVVGHYGHYIGKREADADAYYGHLGYGYGLHGLGYAGYGHGLVYSGVPFGSSTGLDPITQGLDASTQGHLGYGHHYGHYIGKREADADAYYGHLGYGYGLHGLGYAGYGHHGVYAAHVPFGSSTGLDPITQGLDASTQGHLGYYGYHTWGKK